MLYPPSPAVVDKFLSFVNQSPTPFHAVSNAVKRLESAGFIRLKEREDWSSQVKKTGKYYVTRNQSSIIAFAVGGAYQPGNGLAIVGCHTDSPCFKIRPVSKKTKLGYLQVETELYGGGIWPTWFDRDLGIAGRVIVKDSKSQSISPAYTSHLVHVPLPILRIPTIAIHLERSQGDTLKINLEDQAVPILSMANDILNKPVGSTPSSDAKTALSIQDKHHPLLLSILSRSLSSHHGTQISENDIHDLELSLFDINPSTVGGGMGEFIFSPRLDNLFSSFAAIEALAQSVEGDNQNNLEQNPLIRTIALWDNEEIGSVSHQGAQSNFLEAILTRVSSAFAKEPSPALTEQTLAASFLLSCDMGHAVHPCYPEKHQQSHRPIINQGPVIKTNANQRYASNAPTTFLLRRVATLANVPLQEFEVRNDMACGSTIGPLVSKIGLRTVDIGCPQLSMHSIREQAGCHDMVYLTKLFETFFEKFQEVDSSFSTVNHLSLSSPSFIRSNSQARGSIYPVSLLARLFITLTNNMSASLLATYVPTLADEYVIDI
ncbi:hypothetical protein O181_001662 [Austropuccinia psidii MF-1]|uniref:aspartyl aminopeptidase n=1 Tax=Austropuccinia psidii MF-1 TaxID=1389203 RepID=A0A9Q3BB14_9BASI|nr:hypothetical protein [Austropuccinia psidii MF-1]